MTRSQELEDRVELGNEGDGTKAVGAALTIQSQVTPRKTVIIQTTMARDLPARDFHGMVDKFVAVVDRQELKSDLLTLLLTIETAEWNLKLAEQQYNEIGERAAVEWKRHNKKGELKLSATEDAAKHNCFNNIKQGRENLDRMYRDRKKLEDQIAKVD